jgi:hypothetical protein
VQLGVLGRSGVVEQSRDAVKERDCDSGYGCTKQIIIMRVVRVVQRSCVVA